MTTDETQQTIIAAAVTHDLPPAALLALVELESAGKTFALVKGRNEPLIRFEGHYFDRRLGEKKREEARAANLAAPKAGGIRNPRSQEDRWAMLDRAAAVDRQAALESTSWGIGQVMGAHWQWLGYESIEAMVTECRRGLSGQLALMLRYIDKAGLASRLRNRDWAGFARGYNGPAYARSGYHLRLAEAVGRHETRLASQPESQSLPKLGPFARLMRWLGIGGKIAGRAKPV